MTVTIVPVVVGALEMALNNLSKNKKKTQKKQQNLRSIKTIQTALLLKIILRRVLDLMSLNL